MLIHVSHFVNHLDNGFVVLNILHVHKPGDPVSAVPLDKQLPKLFAVDAQRVFGGEAFAKFLQSLVNLFLVDHLHNGFSNKVV